MKKLRILFICHGNICRSPMAEFIMKDLVQKSGMAEQFEIASAATSSEELGNPVYPPARRILARHSIGCAGHAARRITTRDYADYDLLIGMDHANVRNMRAVFHDEPEQKIRLLKSYTGEENGEISDPWYSGDFETAYSEIEAGCRALLKALQP